MAYKDYNFIFVLAWELSTAKVIKSYSRRLPALEQFYLALFQYIRRISKLYYSQVLGSWNLVIPLLSMNEAWMDECAARLQPLVDQYPYNTKLSQ